MIRYPEAFEQVKQPLIKDAMQTAFHLGALSVLTEVGNALNPTTEAIEVLAHLMRIGIDLDNLEKPYEEGHTTAEGGKAS